MKRIILFFFCSLLIGSAANAQQNIAGIGAQLFLDSAGGYTMPRIQALVPNTPAYQFLNATDYIIKVNGVSCKNKSMEDVVGMIRGEAGSTVKITTADTKEGKNAKETELQRVGMRVPGGGAPLPDAQAAFYSDCENEVTALKRQHREIVKTYSSDCGNFFFNFNAENGTYHVLVMTASEKAIDGISGYNASAKVFNEDKQADAVALTKLAPVVNGNYTRYPMEGEISFTKTSVGTIAITIGDNAAKCKGMYVIVYR